ncbi:MAG: hypothetical protein ACR2KK_13860 [Acidimicrobiales bacterium]
MARPKIAAGSTDVREILRSDLERILPGPGSAIEMQDLVKAVLTILLELAVDEHARIDSAHVEALFPDIDWPNDWIKRLSATDPDDGEEYLRAQALLGQINDSWTPSKNLASELFDSVQDIVEVPPEAEMTSESLLVVLLKHGGRAYIWWDGESFGQVGFGYEIADPRAEQEALRKLVESNSGFGSNSRFPDPFSWLEPIAHRACEEAGYAPWYAEDMEGCLSLMKESGLLDDDMLKGIATKTGTSRDAIWRVMEMLEGGGSPNTLEERDIAWALWC